MDFNLAPLGMRRDIAMLGILHTVAWEVAPKPIQSLFSLRPSTLEHHGFTVSQSRHNRQIADPVVFNHPVIIKRSVFGLIRVFNRLPAAAVNAKSVKAFQSTLQNQAKDAARKGSCAWEQMFHAD